MTEDLKSHTGELFRNYSLRMSQEKRLLTPVELGQVNDAMDRRYFAGLNPSWDSREPADVEFMAFGQLGVYDYARAGHLEFP